MKFKEHERGILQKVNIIKMNSQWEANVMKEVWKQFRVGAIVVNCCMLALGLLMVIWPGVSALTVCIVLGILCIAMGIYELVRYFKLGLAGLFFRYDLSLGICGVLAGILLLLHPHGAMVLLPIAAGLYIIIGSILNIQVSVEMRRIGLGNWVAVLILGIIDLVFAMFLLMNPFEGAAALMILAGITLIVGGIQNFYLIYCISKAVKAVRNNKIVDVEWSVVG